MPRTILIQTFELFEKKEQQLERTGKDNQQNDSLLTSPEYDGQT